MGDKFGEDDEGPRLSAALGRAAIFCKYTEAVGFQHHWKSLQVCGRIIVVVSFNIDAIKELHQQSM